MALRIKSVMSEAAWNPNHEFKMAQVMCYRQRSGCCSTDLASPFTRDDYCTQFNVVLLNCFYKSSERVAITIR